MHLSSVTDLSGFTGPGPSAEAYVFPASYAQKRLWFIHQLDPGSPAYNLPLFLRLTGNLDEPALRASLTEIVRRHETLRTSFPLQEGEPVQQVHAAGAINLPVLDLSWLPETDAEQLSAGIRREEVSRAFDLERGPLVRLHLIRLAERRHELLLTFHHIISDGWSRIVLMRELGALYAAFQQGKPSPLPELNIQYADYTVWQRDKLEDKLLEQQLQYWRKQLADVPVLDLPADYPRQMHVTSHPGELLHFSVSSELADKLNKLGQSEGATLFMVLLAAFQWVLGRHAGQDEVAVGTGIANRNRKETEELIGFFVNTLVLRTDLRGGPSLRELLRKVREITLQAYAHQDVPFEKLVEELNPNRDLGQTALFQAMLAFQNAPSGTLEMPDLQVEEIAPEFDLAKFNVMLIVEAAGNTLHGELQFASDIYSRESMKQLLDHLELLLERATEQPDVPLTEISLLRAEERQRIVVDWNRTERNYPAKSSLQALFEDRVRTHPDALAVLHGGEQLTYSQLNRSANQLAYFLHSLGVETEDCVGLCVERGPSMVIGVLGILKAGGAYLPLDPNYPSDRLDYMLKDVDSKVLLTESKFKEQFEGCGAKIICLDEAAEQIQHQSVENPPNKIAGNNLAYVMYTSGSTGRPKGIMVCHQAITRLVINTDYVDLNERDRIGQVANASFDAATFEIWGALLNGASLVIIDRDTVLSPASLSRSIRDQQVSAMFLTTALFNQIARDEQGAFRSVRYLLVGGEAVEPRWMYTVLREGSPDFLLNAYGPTEATTFSICHLVRNSDIKEEAIPIGRPIANTRTYVLDNNMQPLPPGLAGEIYIGGDGLARGYWRLPELTAEKFVPCPFSNEPGRRLYRTGDIGRYKSDGSIVFAGRADAQVKVRGYRIELGEIEASLLQHRAVKEAVVVAFEENGDKQLVGYVSPKQEADLQVGEIKMWLKRRLPEYMVPGRIVALDKMPLTENGKIDRRNLPKPTYGDQAQHEYSAPRTWIEEILCRIWAEVLQVEQVGIEENFFDLGGHSLMATRVISRIRSELGVELPLRILFEQPTVAGLAEAVEAESRRPRAVMSTIVPADRSRELPVSAAQRRLWFLQQLLPDSAAYNVPSYLSLKGDLDGAALAWSLTEIVRRHEVLRTTFPAHSGEPVQEIHPPETVSLPLLDLSGLESWEREEIACQLRQQEAHFPFDLARGPLLRARLVRLSGKQHELLLTIHHIVTDGWSEGILVRELRAFYTAYYHRDSAQMPELQIQYADYACWQHQWLPGVVIQRQLEYWKTQLSGVPALDLPTDHPRLQVAVHPQQTRALHFPSGLTARLKSLGQGEGVTLFMVLMAGFQWLLSCYSRQKDIAVGTVIANRNCKETENLIGFFVNTLVLRTPLDAMQTFRELLGRVRNLTLEAYAHQDVPFEKLVEELNPDRDLGRTPLFQVLMVLQNAPIGRFELPGVEVEELGIDLHEAKFELTLKLVEGSDSVQGQLDYASDLFDARFIEQMLHHYVRLLEAVADVPQMPLSEIQLLDSSEWRRVVIDCNRSDAPVPQTELFHKVLEQHAQRNPHTVAAFHEGLALHYGELNSRANRLARYLHGLGVRPETAVGVCLERSLELIVAIVAIWKAGATYVPLDAAYPKDRLAFIIEDARVAVILTDQGLLDELPAHNARAFCVDQEWEAIEQQSEDNPEWCIFPDSLAYVMYTSGSTGKPKGVMIEHRGMMNHLRAKANDLALTRSDMVAQNAPSSFDISIWQMMVVMLVEGQVQIISDDVARDAFQLLDIVDRLGVTVLETVPTLLGVMFEHQQQKGEQRLTLKTLRCLISNAEALPVQMCEQWTALYPKICLLNTYGATECSDDVSHYVVPPSLSSDWNYAPLGQPVSNMQMYVLDEWMKPAPQGVPGELYLGGTGVGRGYIGHPVLTAEKFVPHPFSSIAGARLYKTGDLGRRRCDGNLEFLGRIDHQIKIRGHRVELGEIEGALMEHPEVKQAVVLLRQDEASVQQLVAYIVVGSAGDAQPEIVRENPEAQDDLGSRLHELMTARFPEYMVPNAYVTLASIPLTVNGKIDRRALPPPGESIRNKQTFVAPRNELETIICDIWAQLLHVPRVGIEDNFFVLGGHSLLATQVIARLRTVLQLDIPLVALFRSPTVAAFAEEVEQLRSMEPEQSAAAAGITAANRQAFRADRPSKAPSVV